jgi:hypothetical protein
VSIKTDKIVTKTQVLHLNEAQADWLKHVMQNPLHGQTPEEEEAYDNDMRQQFFHALDWKRT